MTSRESVLLSHRTGQASDPVYYRLRQTDTETYGIVTRVAA